MPILFYVTIIYIPINLFNLLLVFAILFSDLFFIILIIIYKPYYHFFHLSILIIHSKINIIGYPFVG